MSYRSDGTLQCDMEIDCTASITRIDAKGYAYCTNHGLDRQSYQSCRKLRPHELRRLERGEQLTRY